jgi:glycosyltransferase involved in cell wall biosynthesis
VHTHNVKAHLQGSLAAVLAGAKVVLNTKHGHVFPESRTAIRLNRLALAGTRRVVAVSEDTAKRAVEVERLPPEKLTVIHNGVDLSLYAPPTERRPSTRGNLIHVARLSPEKDQLTLLRSAQVLVERCPDFRLQVVGDGPSRRDLEGMAQALGLGERVIFHGASQDVPALLRAAGMFVLSSRSEGIALTLLEAMATGLPVVATRVGGNAEVVIDGETGLLVPPGDPAGLAHAIGALIADPERAGRMGDRGHLRAQEHFDVRRVVRRYEALYLDLLGGAEAAPTGS